MPVTRGLIIDTPWIDHIIEGRKDWEMRAQPTAIRGWIALIRKGSGRIVALAKLVECGATLSPEEMIETFDHHRIPERMIRSGEVAKWVVPWKLAEISLLAQSVPYDHKNGAVIWVSLSEEVSRQLEDAVAGKANASSEIAPSQSRCVENLSNLTHPVSDGPKVAIKPVSRPTPVSLPDWERRVIGRSRLSAGNLNNNHFYLTDFLNAFPADTIGGKNADQAAPRSLAIEWGSTTPEFSDIDLSKRMFRKRGWVRKFFAAADAKEGDIVVVSLIAPYRVHVGLEPRLHF
jgi:hypothetical protein